MIVSETEATEEVGRQLRAYVARSGSEELRRNLETANTIRLSEGFFRACIARDDRRRNVCLLIDTDKEPTEVRRDPSAEPNAGYAAPGRLRGAPMSCSVRPPSVTWNTSTVLRPGRSDASGTFTAKLSCRLPRR